jgi:DNA-binding LacI/PurR family transcriptional regulator
LSRKPITIRDVARRAGVSAGTVSRSVAGRPGVHEATRQRVLTAVEELRYTPNLAAQRLSTGRNLAIAVIVPFFTSPSVSMRLNGAVSVLAGSPYDLLIHNVETPEQRAHCFQLIPHRRQADGVLIISLSPHDESEVASLARAEMPVVFIDADHPDVKRLPRVIVDDVAGGRAATEHLLDLGHRTIGFVGDIPDSPFHFTSSRDRRVGCRQALEAAGFRLRSEHCAEGEASRPAARRLAREVLATRERPTAIVAASDLQAVGVLEAARELGIAVPGQLSVIGYDDTEMAEVVGLTTIRQPLYRSGQRGMELLLETLRGQPRGDVREVLPSELVVRSTTAPPAA